MANTLEFVSANELEASVASEFMTCPECGKEVHTVPAEGVPAQALRACVECDAVFFMDLDAPPRWFRFR